MFSVVCPEQYHEAFFAEGLRSDGRSFSEARPDFTISKASLSESSEYQSHIVRKGNSVIYINIFPQVTTPSVSGCGFLATKVSFYSSPSEIYPSKDKDIRYSQALHSILYPVLQHSTFPINEGSSAVWAVYLEVLVLVDDGSIFELILDASVAVLKAFFLPVVTIDELEDGSVIVSKSGSLSQIPLIAPNINLSSKTIAIIPLSQPKEMDINSDLPEKIILVDPTRCEELLPNKSDIMINSIANSQECSKKIVNISKRYGPSLPWNLIRSSIE
ncbi:hypothetical protein MDAP_000423 [Mitosporidium daphniae]|uniref:Uncharacterized protein n=1 Tax=Mitosporidium daphniae TaxID=1485682 RepID=A0A098VSX3_9MICR|nr:uncharacterized protein DI09_20p20 [Mitosporidium daphniae]KGG52085.1 hypothetical protein DI09_20p20 [Mitosporidium daphniae]|eukprot:XP_013238543.1 uncharacterized protein DI09_20p20 [Mitosporidium daphniae]